MLFHNHRDADYYGRNLQKSQKLQKSNNPKEIILKKSIFEINEFSKVVIEETPQQRV